MKKLAILLLAAVMRLALAACGSGPAADSGSTDASQPAEGFRTEGNTALPAEAENENGQPGETQDAELEAPSEPDGAEEGSRVLVAYFSATNNTAGIAQKLADGLGADLYEILPQQPYTDADLNYGDRNSRSSAEMDDPAARPAIAGEMPQLEQYDVVLIGYPIWWGEAPRIMSTFIESGDFSGKTVAAFCTSASSGFGSSDAALRAAAGTATWLEGRRFSASASAISLLVFPAERIESISASTSFIFAYFLAIQKPPRVVLLSYTGRPFVYCLLFTDLFRVGRRDSLFTL